MMTQVLENIWRRVPELNRSPRICKSSSTILAQYFQWVLLLRMGCVRLCVQYEGSTPPYLDHKVALSVDPIEDGYHSLRIVPIIILLPVLPLLCPFTLKLKHW